VKIHHRLLGFNNLRGGLGKKEPKEKMKLKTGLEKPGTQDLENKKSGGRGKRVTGVGGSVL